MREIVGLDFETAKIEMRPHYPPVPVGVAIKYPGKKSKYLAWGHPSGNNCTFEQAKKELIDLVKSGASIVCHHAKFDLDVLETYFDIKPPNYDRIEDTMLLGFLDDPHSRSLGLKQMMPKYLGKEPTERDELRAWIIENVPEAKKAKAQWGAYISKAPGNLVAPYANADADQTVALHKVLRKKIKDSGMDAAYMRELKLIPILLANERQGVRVNSELLEADVPVLERALVKVDSWIRTYLHASPELNIDADQQLADALESAGLVKDWIYTTPDKNGKGGGRRSVSKTALAEMVEDKFFLAALEYRGSLTTFTRTFLGPWRDVARETGGWVHTTWNSTAQEEGGGARTGRLSSSKPTNFMNIPSGEKYDDLVAKLTAANLFKKLKWAPMLPRCRKYILADNDKSWVIGRDFSQQEPRVLAHFEDGILCRAYQKNPNLDVYVFAMEEMLKTIGRQVTRKAMKVIILAILYGLGSAKLAEKLGCTVLEARAFKEAFLGVFPEIKTLMTDLKNMFKRGEPLRTWGGRLYYCEQPRVVNGALREFSYKSLNYLIQTSSSDITKESVIRYAEAKKESRFLLTVHDENVSSAPKKCYKQEMKILQESMEGIELDVPLTTDGYYGPNWGEFTECE